MWSYRFTRQGREFADPDVAFGPLERLKNVERKEPAVRRSRNALRRRVELEYHFERAGGPAAVHSKRRLQHLGCQIEWRPAIRGCSKTAAFSSSWIPVQVPEHDASFSLAHDVLRFHIAVQQARCMDGRQRSAHLDPDSCGLLRRHRPLSRDLVRERTPPKCYSIQMPTRSLIRSAP